jgi:IS30 family transposase
MAQELGRAASTISREIHRHGGWGDYEAKKAIEAAGERRAYPWRLDDARVRQVVHQRLQQYHSPAQIVGAWPVVQVAPPSAATIYRYVHHRCPAWHQYLRQARSRRRPGYRQPGKYQRIRNARPLAQRPRRVARRARGGDWESDSLRGADRHAGIATHVDRRTGYVILAKLKDRAAATFNHATLRAFRRHRVRIHTLTADRGMEFACFDRLEAALACKVYFADPHCPWQRGTNENTNGLLRQYFPKDLDFRTITARRLRAVEAQLNQRPRKRLRYRTPDDLALVALHD